MELESVMRESAAGVLASDPTVQGVAVLDPSGLLLYTQARSGCEPIGNEEVLGSLAATSQLIAPNREPGVVTVETETRSICLRKEQGYTVIVAHDPPREDS